MKKNYIFLLVFSIISLITNGQTVLFEQTVDGTNGIVSDNFSDGTASVYSSDDFNLTATSNIDIITAYGFQNQGDFDTFTTGIDVYIYADAAGVPNSNPTLPGTGLLELVNLDPNGSAVNIIPNGTGGYDIEIDVADAYGSTFSLDAGTYWLVFAPYVGTTGGDRWNWYQSTDGTLSPAQLIDPGDVFGAGATSWTSLAGLVGWSSLAFKIEEASLSIGEFDMSQINVTPNPTTEFINIEIPNSNGNFVAELFDITGKQVLRKENSETLNVSQLNSGIYILRIKTDNGVASRRIIKE